MPYRVEYASTGRAGCKGPEPCKGTKIAKGEVRLGTLVKMPKGPGSSDKIDSWAWRHYGCTTKRQITNMKKDIGEDASELDGYEDLREEDQDKIKAAWEAGEVDEADIPESAKKADDDGEEGSDAPKKKKAAPKRKKAESDDEDVKPKKKAAPRKKTKKAETDDDEDVKPKKKAPAKRKTAKEKAAEKAAEEWPASGDEE